MGGLCGGCGGGVAGLITGETFGAGDEVGVTAGGGVAETGGTMVVGGGAVVDGGGAMVVGGGDVVVEVDGEAAGPCALTLKGEMEQESKRRDQMIKFEVIVLRWKPNYEVLLHIKRLRDIGDFLKYELKKVWCNDG
uniref:Uncharacterized protein n=1 Tax=Noccaea caerulescens TaxID=107243 RepID=A0A1J3JRQ2_NOCCA